MVRLIFFYSTVILSVLGALFVLAAAYKSEASLPLALWEAHQWDEFQYSVVVYNFRETLTQEGAIRFLTHNEPFGYSSLYFQVSALLSLFFPPFHTIDASNSVMFALRGISLASMFLSLWLLYLLFRQRNADIKALWIVISVGLMPLGFLQEKAYSVDWLFVLFIILGCYLLSWLRCKSWWHCVLMTVPFGIAVGIKPFAVYFFPLILLIFFARFNSNPLDIRQVFSKPFLARVCLLTWGGFLGFCSSNLYVLRQGFDSYFGKISKLASTMGSADYQHAIESTGIVARLAEWWGRGSGSFFSLNSVGVQEISSPLVLAVTGCYLVITIGLTLRQVKHSGLSKLRSYNGLLLLLSVAGAGFVVAITLTTNRVWGYYLLPGAIFLPGFLAIDLRKMTNWIPIKVVENGKIGILLLHVLYCVEIGDEKFHSHIHRAERSMISSHQIAYHEVILPNRELIETHIENQTLTKTFQTPLGINGIRKCQVTWGSSDGLVMNADLSPYDHTKTELFVSTQKASLESLKRDPSLLKTFGFTVEATDGESGVILERGVEEREPF